MSGDLNKIDNFVCDTSIDFFYLRKKSIFSDGCTTVWIHCSLPLLSHDITSCYKFKIMQLSRFCLVMLYLEWIYINWVMHYII